MAVNLDGIAWLVNTKTSTGEILRVYSAPGNPDNLPEDGSVSGEETVYLLTIREEQEFNFGSPSNFMTQYHRSGNSWVHRGAPATDWYKWNWDTSSWVVNTDMLLSTVRLERDLYLTHTDWTQVSDNQLTDSKKEEWRTYRQSLRDLMANLAADLDDPSKVVWPTQPS